MSPVADRPASTYFQESQAETSAETDKDDYGYGDDEPEKSDCGYGDMEPENRNKSDYGYGYEDADTGSQEVDKSDYGYEDADTNRNLTATHTSREMKARRRGSALGRLQEDLTLSSTNMAIPDAAPHRKSSMRRMSVGATNSKWIDAPIGHVQDYAEQISMTRGNTIPAIRRGSRRRMSVGASEAPLGNTLDNTRRSSRTATSTNLSPM